MTVLWSGPTMINGSTEHGHCKEAIDLVEKSVEGGHETDDVTFIGVLGACSHAGLIDLGFHYFNLMSRKYHINPGKEHYGCMIDLLSVPGD
ncbi:hypothetical protein IFM89_035734 [Coptis chinensis]|uniref:Pentatricopeptide repeat-containing protein n=1 Tax=Coptis chinensis TaxID=261450 RepID=A0A835GZL4_9MAGN|nr:hypothetical protein IFM89_035734 [Coptis chinensis]